MTASPSSRPTFKQLFEQKVLLGQPLTTELAAILLVYFVQGILGLARLAVSFFLKDDLGLSPAEVAAMTGIATLPWTIKPLFGFISDGFPVLGYRRRPYLFASGLLGAAAWLAMATLVDSAGVAIATITLTSLSTAIGDVIVDSLVVERARSESQGDAGTLQSLAWGTSALGGIITAYLGGLLLEQVSTRTVFAITATFPLIVSIVAWLIAEEPVAERSSVQVIKSQVSKLWQAISQKAIWMPALFLFLWQATPTADAAFFFFTTNELGFEPEFLGRVRLVTSMAALAGVWVFQRFLRGVSFRRIFAWSTVLSCVLGMSMLLLVTHANRSLGIDDHWFSLGDSLILAAMGEIAFMPVLVLSTRICPPGVEATLFALLMSIVNLAGLLSHELGALLTHWLGVSETEFGHLWQLVLLTNLSTLLPLPLLFLLPSTTSQAKIQPPPQASVPDSQPVSVATAEAAPEVPVVVAADEAA